MRALALAVVLFLSPNARQPDEIARLVTAEAARYQLDVVLVLAVMYRESSFRRGARSGRGDLGLMQVRRGIATAGYDDRTDAELMAPALNVRLGSRRLARARRRCGGGDPATWLGGYAGLRCGSSGYSARVLETAGKVKAALATWSNGTILTASRSSRASVTP